MISGSGSQSLAGVPQGGRALEPRWGRGCRETNRNGSNRYMYIYIYI